jgi:hypothetical protein
MLHLPILRAGRPYRSLNTVRVTDIRNGRPLADVSQANRGLISKDLGQLATNQRALAACSTAHLVDICLKAAAAFMNDPLPLDSENGTVQTPADYVSQTSATTGMPEALCRANMQKIRGVMEGIADVLGGLTRGMDLSVLDAGWGDSGGRTLSYLRETDALGAVLPSNSPGVHSLWVPAIPLKVPVVLKPGSEEPWTPFRIAQAFISSGCPPEAFSFYPAGHDGAAEILMSCGRSMLFGGGSTVAAWRNDPRVELHGPGWSKVLLCEDTVDDWESHLDLIVGSIAANGGRSCINASGVWVPRNGETIARGIAKRLAAIEPLPLDHPEAALSAFTRPAFAKQISDTIDSQLRQAGAVDLTAEYRSGDRLVEIDGCTFLRPTLVWCEDPDHPLANTEFLFPFASVVETPQDTVLRRIGPTLVLSAVTHDNAFRQQLLAAPGVDRLNCGAIPTQKISWDQPHEGNLFEHLYRQRAFQAA